MFNSVAIYDCSIVQQCRMLEALLGTTVPEKSDRCHTDNKEMIIKTDFSKLLATASRSAHLAGRIGNHVLCGDVLGHGPGIKV